MTRLPFPAASLCIVLASAGPAAAQPDGVQIDLTVNLTAILTVAAMVAGGIAAWVTVRSQVKTNKSDIAALETRLAASDAKNELMAQRIEQVRAKSAHELDAFKLEVAREYATAVAVRMVEERIASALEKLDARLEKLDNRLAGFQAPRRPRSPSSDK